MTTNLKVAPIIKALYGEHMARLPRIKLPYELCEYEFKDVCVCLIFFIA
jgi:hypothetical protein